MHSSMYCRLPPRSPVAAYEAFDGLTVDGNKPRVTAIKSCKPYNS